MTNAKDTFPGSDIGDGRVAPELKDFDDGPQDGFVLGRCDHLSVSKLTGCCVGCGKRMGEFVAATVPDVTVMSNAMYAAGVEIGKLEGQAILDRQTIARLERELWAVRVLDRWAAQGSRERRWSLYDWREDHECEGVDMHLEGSTRPVFSFVRETPAEARQAAALALVAEDPSLATE
jgi:hypothetical protein